MRKLWVLFLPLLFFSSCELIQQAKDRFVPSSPDDVSLSVNVPSSADSQNISDEIASVSSPTIILMKGNNLVYGLPCFDENAIQAVKGEYKIEMPDNTIVQTGEDVPLFVNSWLTSEFLYFSPDLWKPRRSLQNFRAMEMRDDENLYIVLRFPDTIAGQEKWTILFGIPGESIAAGINDSLITRMIQNWTSKLSYYISISQSESQISLPAVITF